jgi:hypothetical protein
MFCVMALLVSLIFFMMFESVCISFERRSNAIWSRKLVISDISLMLSDRDNNAAIAPWARQRQGRPMIGLFASEATAAEADSSLLAARVFGNVVGDLADQRP